MPCWKCPAFSTCTMFTFGAWIERACSELHALIEDMPPSESACILEAMNRILGDRFHIHHTTIQFEHARCALSETGCHVVCSHSEEHQHSH